MTRSNKLLAKTATIPEHQGQRKFVPDVLGNKPELKRALYWLAGIIAAGLIYLLLFKVCGIAIPCLFHQVTGWYCPGCGVTRMLLALLQFNFVQAFYANPLLLMLLPDAALLGLNYLYALSLNQRHRAWFYRVPNWVWLGLIVLMLSFGMLRNLPALSFLAPH